MLRCVSSRRFLKGGWALILAAVASPLAVAVPGDVDALAKQYAGLGMPSGTNGGEPVAANSGKEKGGSSAEKQAWEAYEKAIGVPLRAWAKQEVRPPEGGTVFYPFSGPDFVTVGQMFPEADRYVLVAIQPAGPVVDLTTMGGEEASAFRSKFRVEWEKFGQLGFFRTLDLNENTASAKARLTSTPVMMAFAAALGYRVESVLPLEMVAEKGDYEVAKGGGESSKELGNWKSVRLALSRGGKKVTLDYVCLDLSDGYLKAHEAEQNWIRKMTKAPVLLKAASHLLPKPYFSVCREAIVQGAPLLVQDETGLEYGDLQKMGAVTLYGKFAGVLKLFNPDSQKDLVAAYAAAGETRPLPFAFSYQKSVDRRSLQVVRRESNLAAPGKP